MVMQEMSYKVGDSIASSAGGLRQFTKQVGEEMLEDKINRVFDEVARER
jgi:hypothetical protein